MDYTEKFAKNGKLLESAGRPAGVQIVDTKRWTVRTLDPGGSTVVVADGTLLVTGGSFRTTDRATTWTGMGLVAYGADGARRFQLFARQRAYVSCVSGGRGYVSVGDAAASIVDLASGQLVGSAPRSLPYLIDV
jgi:hypothetical protein